MSRTPLFSVVIYIATRLALDGDVVDESLVALFARAGLHLASREIVVDPAAPGAPAVAELVEVD
jgi:hypothetical protein